MQFDVAGELYELPDEAVTLMAEDTRHMRLPPDDWRELADLFEDYLVGRRDPPVRVTRQLAVFLPKLLTPFAASSVSPYRVEALALYRAIERVLDAEIRLSGEVVSVSSEKRSELQQRLERRADAGDGRAAHALGSLRHHRPPTHEDKHAIYDELDAWLAETSSLILGEELMRLRSALQTDLDLGTKT